MSGAQFSNPKLSKRRRHPAFWCGFFGEERMIFKVEAQGDTLYIEAESRAEASKQFQEKIGPVPQSMLTWTDNVELPEDEELL